MESLSRGQQRVIADFCNNLALAWFSSGVILSFFTLMSLLDKLSNVTMGLAACYVFIGLALHFSKNLK